MSIQLTKTPWTPVAPDPPGPLEVPGWYAKLTVQNTGIPSAEAFGACVVALSQKVFPSGIASGESVSAPVVRYIQNISMTGIASMEAFGGSALDPGDVSILAQGITSGQAFGTPTMVPGGVLILPVGISGGVFGTATITTGPVSVSPSGISSGEAFGSPALKYIVAPTGIVSEESFGALKTTEYVTGVGGIASQESVSPFFLSGGIWEIHPNGIPTQEAFGGSLTAPGTAFVLPQGIAPGSMGTPAISVGSVNITNTGIASAEAFGTLKTTEYIVPGGISSAESVGASTVTSNYPITGTGIGSAEAFGTTVVTAPDLPISIIGHTGPGSLAITVAIPAHQVGDLIIIAATVQSATIPTAPAAGGTVPTWTTIDAAAGSVLSSRIVYAVATATNHTSGSFSNSVLSAIVIRGQNPTTPIGGHAMAFASATVATAPTITLVNNSGSSLILAYHFLRLMSGNWGTVPAGYTLFAAVGSGSPNQSICTKDSSTSVSSCTRGSQASALGAGGCQVEILT